MEMNPTLYEILSIAERVNLSFALFINLVLLFLIIRRTSKDIGNYRFLLFSFVINDIFFTIIHAITLPIACTYGDAFIIFATGIWSSKLSISYYAATFSQTMPLLMHLFLYRFFAMKMPLKTSFYTPRNTAIIILGTVIVESNIWCWGSFYLYSPDSEAREYLTPFFVDEFDGFEYLAQLYWFEDQFRWTKAVITVSFDVFLGTFLAVIIYCSVKIFKHFEEVTVTWSAKTRRMQKQLFHILIVQMIIPLVFVFAPCAGIISLPIARTGLNVFPNLVSFSLTIFPVLDPLIVIFGVKNYRNAILSFTRLKRFQDSSVRNSQGPANQASIFRSTTTNADFARDLSSKDREEFMKINRDNKDITEKQLLSKIGDWAKEKGLETQWAVEREWKSKEKSSLLRHLHNFEHGLESTFNKIESSMRHSKLTRQQIETKVGRIFETNTGSAAVIRKIMEEHRRSFDFDRQPKQKDDMKKHITHFASFSAAFLDVILKRTKRSVQKVPAMLAKLARSIRDESATIAENARKYDEMLEKKKDEGAIIAVETIFEMARLVASEERKRDEKTKREEKKTPKTKKKPNTEL